MALSTTPSPPKNMKMTKQQKQIYAYLRANEGATVREMRNNTFPSVQKPCMRLAEMDRLGIIESLTTKLNERKANCGCHCWCMEVAEPLIEALKEEIDDLEMEMKEMGEYDY